MSDDHADVIAVLIAGQKPPQIGLRTRINPPSTVHWFDIDFPDVIQLRKNFYTDQPGYQMIEASITDPTWLAEIPTGEPVMIIAEGVLEYLTGEEVKILLNRLTGYFSHGEKSNPTRYGSEINTHNIPHHNSEKW